MPLPLVIPIIVAAAGAIGAGKSVKAVSDNKHAQKTNKRAQSIVEDAQEELENSKTILNNTLSAYGKQKLTTIDTHLRKFIEIFDKIKNIEFANGEKIDDLSQISITKEEMKEISNAVSLVENILVSGIAGVSGGILTAFGAYSGTALLATASTGTAIGTLSGAAATNATLAWIGGGSLAAGGLGVAGGTMVLGVLVAGPALLIFGSILGAQAKKKRDEAKAKYEQAKEYKEELSLIIEKLQHITQAVQICHTVLDKFSGKLRRANKTLENILQTSGFDYQAYTDKEKEFVFVFVKIVQILKLIIEFPLLTEDGDLIEESVQKISGITLDIS